SGAMSSSECVRPQIEAIMTSYRDPVTSHVSTWSALGAQRDSGVSKSSTMQSSRYSRMSSMSISSNDTACASSGVGQYSLAKDIVTPPLPHPPLPHLAAVDSSPAQNCERPF
ncbi:hypothetical protein GGI05_002966, partial [Coemansia sp. RSA 2603]